MIEPSRERRFKMAESGPYFILDEAHQVIEATVEEWSAERQAAKEGRSRSPWRVALTVIYDPCPAAPLGIWVSTVFTGLDHCRLREGGPEVFETMVFQGPLHADCVRSSIWDEALKLHDQFVELAKAAGMSNEKGREP